MPYKDHTGPNGAGPMSGRQLGDCNKTLDTTTNNDRPRLGLGRGAGRPQGSGRNRRPQGRGRRIQERV